MKKVSLSLAILIFCVFFFYAENALANFSWDTQEDFLIGAYNDSLELRQSSGDIKLKQNLNTSTQASFADFQNGNNNNSGIIVRDTDEGGIALNEFYSYAKESGDAYCDYGYMATPIYDNDSGFFYCGSLNDGLVVIDTKKTDSFLDDERVFTYSTASSPAISSNRINQIAVNSMLNVLYIATANGVSVIDTKGTNDFSDDELINTYSTTSSPAISNNNVWYVDFNENSGLLYVNAYAGGLSVINTQNTLDSSDDILVINYSTVSSPAISGNRVSASLFDEESSRLFIGTWNNGISVIDTKGTISSADDVLLKSYSTTSTPHLKDGYIERLFLDKENNMLYAAAQSGVPGALNVVDLENDTSFAYNSLGVYDTTDSATGTLINSDVALGTNSVKDIFLHKATGYIYVAHYNSAYPLTVIDTKKTFSDPSDDTIYATYDEYSEPKIFGSFGWRMGYSSEKNMLFLSGGSSSKSVIYFIPLEERDEYQGRYYSEYFKYTDVPSESISWQGNIEKQVTNINIRSTADEDLVDVISNFDDGDTSEFLGDYYGWGAPFQDFTESDGTMKISNPSPKINCSGQCAWVDFWIDTGKSDGYYPAGSIVEARVRINSDNREMYYYQDAMIVDEQWSSHSDYFFENNKWKIVKLTAQASFSKIGFDINWKTGTWDNTNDSFEVDWIKVYKNPELVTWSDWSSECVNSYGCEIPKSEGDEYFQYRINMSGTLDDFNINDVTLSSGYPSSGTYISDNRELSEKNKELINLTVDREIPEGTAIALEYSLDGGDTWIDVGNVQEYIFPEKTRSNQFQWRATLRSDNSNETPVIRSLVLNPKDVELQNPIKSEIEIKMGDDSKELEKRKNYYMKEKNPKLSGNNEEIAGGKVIVYKRTKNGSKKVVKEIAVDKNGKWSGKIDLSYGTNYIYFRTIDSTGNESELSSKIKINIDTEEPEFGDFPNDLNVAKGEKIYFSASDSGTGLDYYKLQLVGHRGWRSQNDDYYIIPDAIPYGDYVLDVKAYDKAGNKSMVSINIKYREREIQEVSRPGVDQENNQEEKESDVLGIEIEKRDQDKIILPTKTPDVVSPQDSKRENKKWWNPLNWF